MWLARVKEELGDDLKVTWRSFALEQVNSKEGEDWKSWEQGPEYVSRGLWPLRGGIAARRLSEHAHMAYMDKVLELKHVERVDVRSRESVIDVAKQAGLDVERFTAEIDDPSTLTEIGRDYEEARAQGVFGTPTFVFEDGSAAFLKTYTPPDDYAVEAFEHFLGMARNKRFFGELKRPQPPWPRGSDD
jgi:predicted DsbA family dithiol-disulfide isomerase